MSIEPEPDAVSAATATVSAVTIKLPPYWASDPHVWFAQVEAQFSTRGISAQRTRFDHVVASLSPEIATEVRDLILSPPADTPYTALKEQLIGRTAASEQKRLQLLLTAEELGDRKPSQLLRRMQQLLGDKRMDDSLLRQLFLQRLPSHVRMVLASSETVALAELAKLADRIMEVAVPSVSTVASPPPTELDQLRSEIASLKQMVQSLSSPSFTRRSRSRQRSPTPSRSDSPTAICWYHRRFGDSARKCLPPCAKSGNGQASR